MKRILVLIFLTLFARFSVRSQNLTYKNLIGVWFVVDTEDSTNFEFLDSTNLVMIFKGFKMPNSTYKIDTFNHPNLLILETVDGGLKRKSQNLIELLGNDTLKMQMLTSRDRKDSFDNVTPNKIGLLVRKKNSP